MYQFTFKIFNSVGISWLFGCCSRGNIRNRWILSNGHDFSEKGKIRGYYCFLWQGHYHLGIQMDTCCCFGYFFHDLQKCWSILDVAQAAEAIQMVSSIIKYRSTYTPNTVKNATFTLAKIYLSAGQLDKAKDWGNRALDGKSHYLHFLTNFSIWIIIR